MIVSFDANVQERNCTVLFELNGEFDICVTVIAVAGANTGLLCFYQLSNKVKVSTTYRNQTEERALLLRTHFSSKWHMKMLAKTGPKGEPIATPSI